MKVFVWKANDFPVPGVPNCAEGKSSEEIKAEHKAWRSKLIEGEPKGRNMSQSLELKDWGVVGLYQEIDIDDLLNKAKSMEAQFQKNGMPLEEVDFVSDAWVALYNALALVRKFKMIRDNGDIDEVRSLGILYDSHKLSYSSAENSEMLFSGTNLMSVESIEEM